VLDGFLKPLLEIFTILQHRADKPFGKEGFMVVNMSYPTEKLKRKPQPGNSNNATADVQTAPDLSSRTSAKVLQLSAAILKRSDRLALVSTLGLLAVWLIGRVMETLHGKMVFDMTLTYWLGLIIYILIAIWAIGFVFSASDDLRTARQKKLAILCWLFFISLIAALLLSFKGYRISSEGLLATIAGSQEPSEMSIFLLYKYHYMNPLLALNLVAAKIMGLSWGVESFAPFVWSWNVLLGFFIWSVAYGILLLLRKDRQGMKSAYIVFSAFGLIGLIVLKSASSPTIEQMIMIQAAATILIVAQVLLAYTALREIAAGPSDPDPKTVDTLNGRLPSKDQALGKRFAGLPPSAVKLALVLFLVIPLTADMSNQFLTASSSKRILHQVTMDADNPKTGFTAVTAMSIRSGPTRGDDLIGILPKGSHIQVRDMQNGWVEIGENKWIQEKFIRPPQGK
jgi:hypothetical protein